LNTFKPLIPTVFVAFGIREFIIPSQVGIVYLFIIAVIIGITQIFTTFATKSLDAEDIFIIEEIERRTQMDLSWLKTFSED
jgi:hypothetical protein